MSNLKRNFCKKSDYIDEAWDEEWRAETAKNLAGMVVRTNSNVKKKKSLKKKIITLMGIFTLASSTFTGCSFEDEANVASYNISKEADNFNVYRKVTVINNQSDAVMLEFEGWCSIHKDNTDEQLEITYRVGEGEYFKDFIGLNDRTTYVITQIDGSNVDKYHYEWLYHSNGDLIPIEIKDADA